MFVTSLIADIRVSSPKISQLESGSYAIEMLIEGNPKIEDKDFKLFDYKSNNPLTNEYITSIILEDLNSFQRLSINLAGSYSIDYFAYRLNILNSYNKDIFVFLPDNPIKSNRQGMLSQNFTVPPNNKRLVASKQNLDASSQLPESEKKLENSSVQESKPQDSNLFSETDLYITNPGDTMWSVSSSVSDQFEADIYQIMWGIFLHNPAAFIDGDINKLISNIAIEFPNKLSIKGIDAEFAKQSVRSFLNPERENFPRLTLSAPKDNLNIQVEQQRVPKNNGINSNLSTKTAAQMTPQEIIEANTSKIFLNAEVPSKNSLPTDSSFNSKSIMFNLILVFLSLVSGFLLALVFIKRKNGVKESSSQSSYELGYLPEGLGIENNQDEQNLDLARTYVEMGAIENAESIISSVIKASNDPKILEDAQTLLKKIKG
ncbi:MAG: FimV/HubP family polar landmark protein [Gammaproteobacteria bacterium]